MANALYTSIKKTFLDGGINLDTADIRVVLVDTAAYTFSAVHDFLDDVPGGARIAVSGSLLNTTTTGGVFDADDINIPAVSGATIEAAVIYNHDGGVDTARKLISYHDGLTFTPNGSGVDVQFNAAGIFEI